MKLPRDVSGAQTIRALHRLGFQLMRQTGSHARLAREGRRVTVPLHGSLAPGTLRSILRQVGITLDEFLAAL